MWDVPFLSNSEWLIESLKSCLSDLSYSWYKNPYFKSDESIRSQMEDSSMKSDLLSRFEFDVAYSSPLMTHVEAGKTLENFVSELTDGGIFGDIIFDDWDVDEQHF